MGTDLVVIAITDIKAFDPPITNVLDIMGQIAQTRATYDSWNAIIGDTPIALAMPPEARRGVDSALHFRQFTAEHPKNLVLGAEPAQWPDALYDRYGESTESAPQKILVVGDSVGFSLATEFRPEGSVVWDQTRHGCDPPRATGWLRAPAVTAPLRSATGAPTGRGRCRSGTPTWCSGTPVPGRPTTGSSTASPTPWALQGGTASRPTCTRRRCESSHPAART
ncbi:MAG: hypothetical protein R2716_09265 [Microthrixaceae bacterium]